MAQGMPITVSKNTETRNCVSATSDAFRVYVVQPGGFVSSYGVILRVNGECVSKQGCFLGDCTNNVVEYRGGIAALRHALANPFPRVYVRMDSYLVVQQLNGRWACRNDGLKPLYEEGLRLMAAICQHTDIYFFTLEHICREYNSDSDGIANETIDSYQEHVHVSGIVVDHNWSPLMHLFSVVRESLTRRDGHGLDNEGDAHMALAPVDESAQHSAVEHGILPDAELGFLMDYSVQ